MSALYLPTRWLITSGPGTDDPDLFPLLIGQSFLVSKRPEWKTTVATATSGSERRRKVWSYPVWHFKVAYEVLRDAPTTPDLDRLTTFFNLHAGMYAEFFFLDPGDSTVIGQAFGTGDGVTTTFQLVRSKSFGGASFTEPVRGLIGTPTVFVGAAPVTTFTIGSRGSITFATAPATGAALTWSGRFLFAVRFEQDDLDMAQMMTALWSQDGLAFMSAKR